MQFPNLYRAIGAGFSIVERTESGYRMRKTEGRAAIEIFVKASEPPALIEQPVHSSRTIRFSGRRVA